MAGLAGPRANGTAAQRPARPPLAHDALAFLGVTAAYVLTGKLGLLLAFENASATPVWAASGIALAALLLLGPRAIGAVFLGAFLVNVTTAGTAFTALGIAAGNTGEAVLGAWLTTRFAHGPRAFERARDFFVFVVGACVLAPMVAATAGVLSLAASGLVEPGASADVWRTWWVGDAAGALLVTPLLVLWAHALRERRVPRAATVFEAAAFGGILLAATFAVFGFVRPFTGTPIGFALVPLVVYAALRFGPLGTATAVLAQASIALAGTLRGHGPFVVEDVTRSLLYLQGFWAVLALTGLGLAIVAQERRAALQAVAVGQDRIQSALDGGAFGTWDYDVATRTLAWDERCRAVFGLPPGTTVTYEAFLGAIHPDDRAGVADAIERAQRPGPGGGTVDVEYRLARAGEPRWVRAFGRCHFQDDEPVRFVGVVRDVTQDREAELARRAVRDQEVELAALRAQDVFKTRLFNQAAHELNTPLTPLLMQVDMLRTPEMGPLTEKQASALDLLERNLKRLEGLVGEMLDVARLQGGRGAGPQAPVRLDQLLDDVVASYRPAAAKAGVGLTLDASWGLRVEGDEGRLNQVFGNLLSNALKFTPRGGRVRVTASAEGKRVRVAVEDSGLGLDEKEAPRLFQPFVQLATPSAKTNGTGRGSGLGLYISRLIVQSHGGAISVASDGPGRGATFTVTLPTLAPVPATGPEVTSAGRAPGA